MKLYIPFTPNELRVVIAVLERAERQLSSRVSHDLDLSLYLSPAECESLNLKLIEDAGESRSAYRNDQIKSNRCIYGDNALLTFLIQLLGSNLENETVKAMEYLLKASVSTGKDNDSLQRWFSDLSDFIETVADFSNGNVAQGVDEGDTLGWECWERFKARAATLGLFQNDPETI